MDQSRFDSLARAMAEPVTRRRGVLLLIGGFLSLTGRIGPESALGRGQQGDGRPLPSP